MASEKHREIQWMELRIKQMRGAVDRLTAIKDVDALNERIAAEERLIASAHQRIAALRESHACADEEIKEWRAKISKLVRACEAAEDHPELIPFMTVQRQLKGQGFSEDEVKLAWE
jgi:predicted  nucleic acid-binding Zn-ribbon protein